VIVVLGHTHCGAVTAAVSGTEPPTENLARLLERINTGGKLPRDHVAALETAIRNHLLYQASLLSRRSPIIRDFTTSQRVRIVPALSDLKTGMVQWVESPRQ
jgi:carbonic anhydrase